MLALGRGLAGAARGALTALRVSRGAAGAGERPRDGGGSREAGRTWVCSDGRGRACGRACRARGAAGAGAGGGLRASTVVPGARPAVQHGSCVK